MPGLWPPAWEVLVSVTLVFQGAVSGSVQASDRLMKELRDIYRSQSYKAGEHVAPGSRPLFSVSRESSLLLVIRQNQNCLLTPREGCET